MLTRPWRDPLALFLILFSLSLFPAPASGQTGTPAIPSAAELSLQVRQLRQQTNGLRSELKRQQKATGILRRELEGLEKRGATHEAESSRLRQQLEALTRWLYLLSLVSVAGVVLGLIRRGGAASPVAPLAIARERTGRIHEGLAALEARIQIIEQRSPRG